MRLDPAHRFQHIPPQNLADQHRRRWRRRVQGEGRGVGKALDHLCGGWWEHSRERQSHGMHSTWRERGSCAPGPRVPLQTRTAHSGEECGKGPTKGERRPRRHLPSLRRSKVYRSPPVPPHLHPKTAHPPIPSNTRRLSHCSCACWRLCLSSTTASRSARLSGSGCAPYVRRTSIASSSHSQVMRLAWGGRADALGGSA